MAVRIKDSKVEREVISADSKLVTKAVTKSNHHLREKSVPAAAPVSHDLGVKRIIALVSVISQ